MIGIEIDGSGAELRKRLLFGKHIFTGGAGASTVRLLPALCLTHEMDRFRAFDAAFKMRSAPHRGKTPPRGVQRGWVRLVTRLQAADERPTGTRQPG